MTRCTACLASLLLVGGCGISLDVDPRSPDPTPGSADAGERDAGRRRIDAAVVDMDAAAADAGGSEMDSGGNREDAAGAVSEGGSADATSPPPRDASVMNDASVTARDGSIVIREGGALEASVADAAVRPDASPGVVVCSAAMPCVSMATVCQAATAGTCGLGTCVPRLPCGPPTGIPAFCGCNGSVYDTRALASCAGTDVRRPPAMCCFTDGDCGGVGRCVGADCTGGHAGACRVLPMAGQCWDSSDCPTATPRCTAGPCNCSACPPAPGTCGLL